MRRAPPGAVPVGVHVVVAVMKTVKQTFGHDPNKQEIRSGMRTRPLCRKPDGARPRMGRAPSGGTGRQAGRQAEAASGTGTVLLSVTSDSRPDTSRTPVCR